MKDIRHKTSFSAQDERGNTRWLDVFVEILDEGKFGFLDAGHARLVGDRKLRCVLTVPAARVVWDSEGLSLTEWTHAGPYSNFK